MDPLTLSILTPADSKEEFRIKKEVEGCEFCLILAAMEALS